MSAFITNEYRYDYFQLQKKLGVKRMFVRYVSHEVRTPLSSCMMGIEYMKAAISNPTESCIQEIVGILDEVSEGCNTAIDFMNNLLLYEKIDSMEIPLYLKREDLSVVCADVLKTFQMSARQLGINLSLDVHESLSTTPDFKAISEIDGPKVVIVLRNLTSNALKFTPKGGKVSLSIIPMNIADTSAAVDPYSDDMGVDSVVNLPPSLPHDTTHFRVILSDTGRGMSQEEQKQLFTKIVQFSPNENQKGGGSGIGLFLSHQIMAGHNLKIQVYSEGINGRGTQFFVDFPVMLSGGEETSGSGQVSDAVASPQQQSSMLVCCPWAKKPTIQDIEAEGGGDEAVAAGEQKEDDVLQGGVSMPKISRQPSSASASSWPLTLPQKALDELSILIVDDSPLNRKMLIRTLKQHQVGASYEDVGDDLELLALLGVPANGELSDVDADGWTAGSDKYDVIILDDNMTYMNGSEAVKKLREHGYEGLVVGVTGSAREEDLDDFCAAGVDYALPKPFVIEDFIDLLKLRRR
jgi:signal transduction histidine kinase